MGKQAAPRRLDETEASAYAHALKTSPRKLNLVAQAIRGKAASAALNELAFNRRRIARDVRKVLQAAIANAENNHQLDVDRLYVKEATVGRAFSLGRFHVRGRGRISPIEKYFANLLVVVRERAPEERAAEADEGAADAKAAGAGKKPKAKAKAGGKEKA
ncbi:MAG: 50S ribosomal protein L22 [Alphaproteobacteria bacterium]|nr:50S ribosomal protein L22 [Alphaproteobacteria bacterium]MDE1968392.1 50S ribosomal protein L22 [Alphaproteobacteria bacterium]